MCMFERRWEGVRVTENWISSWVVASSSVVCAVIAVANVVGVVTVVGVVIVVVAVTAIFVVGLSTVIKAALFFSQTWLLLMLLSLNLLMLLLSCIHSLMKLVAE
uniref:Uncharacterized protein n=1 Tax=Octopus bimaculoides TaxID=37653 RepID=A0A0L8HQ36_OCTBM